MPYLDQVVTDTTIKIAVYDYGTIDEVTKFEFFCRLDIDGAETISHAWTNSVWAFTNLIPNTCYVLNVKIFYADGREEFVEEIGTYKVYTAKSGRPEYFEWTYSKEAQEAFNLTADEWNELTNNINEVRVYRGYDEYSFTKAYPDYVFTADMYNEAVEAIQDISGYGTYLYTVEPGYTVTAKRLNDLRDELNAIP